MTGTVNLSYDDFGTGPVLVLLHGVGHDRTAWNPIREKLAAHRRVIAVDLPGHGDSPPLPGAQPYTVASYTDAVRRLIAGLGVDRPQVAGNSMGGAIALELALSGDACAVTALSPAGFWTDAQARFAMASLRASRLVARAALPAAPILVKPAALRAVLLSQYFAHPARLPPDDALAAVRAFAGSQALLPTLPHLRHYRFAPDRPTDAPVTIGWGTRDWLLTAAQGRRARQILPWARHIWLPGCGHAPMSDAPHLVTTVILETPSTQNRP